MPADYRLQRFLLAVEDLNAYSIPQAGTNIENAIEEARRSFAAGSQGVNRALIILSDGESHEGNPAAAAEQAAKENITIYTIGVGTTEGELISVSDENGNSSFLKDSEGRVVKSRLNEALLQDIALKSAGMYVKATPTRFGLDMVYNNKIASMEKKELKSSMEKQLLERFQFPLSLALLCLFIEPFISNRKRQ
ncbi:MAG: VWA domain-containing protein [Candidatus Omnitrophica bacterium]|nr:VWA domain-containing protein [Candidatus Omnitrophota bacterium]